MARRSLEKPVYKEKLRVRSYGLAGPDEKVFVELKKKFDSVVYKCRFSVAEKQAVEYLAGIDKLRCRNGNLEISISHQETAVCEL